MTDTVGVSSALSVSVVNTPGSKSRHAGEKAAGQLTAERPESSANEFLEGYEMGPVIGEGGFCKVKRGKHRAAQQHVAIKVINKVRISGNLSLFVSLLLCSVFQCGAH